MLMCEDCYHSEDEHMAEGEVKSGARPCFHVERTPGGRGIQSVCACKKFISRENNFKKCVVDALNEYDEELDETGAHIVAEMAWGKFLGYSEETVEENVRRILSGQIKRIE